MFCLFLLPTEQLRNTNKDTFRCLILLGIVEEMRHSNPLQKTATNTLRVIPR